MHLKINLPYRSGAEFVYWIFISLFLSAFCINVVQGQTYTRHIAKKYYEMKDHLGNVTAVVSDKKNPVNVNDLAAGATASVESYTNYYAYGMEQPGRNFSSPSYRYGYNGKEKDNELKGTANSLDYGARIYDPRNARFLSIDPLQNKYPGRSPYLYAANNPILFIDKNGEAEYNYTLTLQVDSKGKQSFRYEYEGQENYFNLSGTPDTWNVRYGQSLLTVFSVDEMFQITPQNFEVQKKIAHDKCMAMLVSQVAVAVAYNMEIHNGAPTLPPSEAADPTIGANIPSVPSSVQAPDIKKPILYRGDARVPIQMAEQGGLHASGTDLDLLAHVKGYSDLKLGGSAYLGTTGSEQKAFQFAQAKQLGGRLFPTIIYHIDPELLPFPGVDVNTVLGTFANRHHYEQEIAIPYTIPESAILGWRYVPQVNGQPDLFKPVDKVATPLITNPSYGNRPR